MKKVLFLVAVIFSSLCLFAQMPGMGGGAPRGGIPTLGRIYGKLVDSTGKGIGDASVLLLESKFDSATKKNKEVLLKGMTTQANGDFNFEELPIFKPLKLKISALGQKPIDQTVTIQPKMDANMPRPPQGQTPGQDGQMPDLSSMASAFEKDLGKITMEQDLQQLGVVTVTTTSSRLRMDIDKKVFNVDQNIVSAGGTAVDVMKNVPSLNVDIDGNVSLRNARPQIYIDGRPTTLTLDQIPADAIESVEVITNPSAKYDASGGNAGILNIVLKKNKKIGYNGTIQAGVDKRGGLNGGGSFSVRQNKFNVSVSAFGNQMKNRSTSSTDVRSLLTSPNILVDQNGNSRMNGGFIFGRASVDYFATNRTSFFIGATKVHGSFKPGDLLTTDSTYEGGPFISYSERNTMNQREFNSYGLQGGFKYLFPKQGQELTGDANFSNGDNEGTALYNTNIYNSNGGTQKGNIRQQINSSGTNQFFTIQSDYVAPLSASSKLEAGARAQLRKLSNTQGNYYWDSNTSKFILISSATSNYKNEDNVYAAYATFTNTIKDFGYKIGLRAESSNYEGELINTKQKFSNDYPISLFPSVFLSQKLQNKQEVQVSYTRRINRPFFMQLIPFIDSTDQLNWSRGNGDLKPEFTTSVEASYSKTLKGNNTILASVYYKHSTDLITRFLDTITINNTKRPLSTYINANSSRSYGAELTGQFTVAKWWDMNANVNLYNSRINAENITGASQDAIWSWFAKANNTFKLPSNFRIQLSGTYQSKTNLPVSDGGGGFGGGGGRGGGGFGSFSQSAAQGYIKANYGVDFAIQKSFLKQNAASVTFNVSDVFRTRRFTQYSESQFFIQNSARLSDVPMMRLTFSFRFGQMDMSLFKRKNTKAEQEGTQGAMQGMGQ
jgi:outer membrane receptor protein involved in Fe transport